MPVTISPGSTAASGMTIEVEQFLQTDRSTPNVVASWPGSCGDEKLVAGVSHRSKIALKVGRFLSIYIVKELVSGKAEGQP